MLVFGDRERRCDPRAALAELARAVDAIASSERAGGANAANGAGGALARHGAIAGAFVDASELAQGLADAACAPDSPEARTAVGDAAMRVVAALAEVMARSWDGQQIGDLAQVRAAVTGLAAMDLPASIAPRTAEGYAYYALYPEAYLEAARAAVAAQPGPRRVIGIRSIGAGLAAIVACACDAPLPATVRPRGDPQRRRVAVAPELAREWAGTAPGTAPDAAPGAAPGAASDATTPIIAIVDEGPGLSGSSFGAVIDAVRAAGVPEARIELYPGHTGEPGPVAPPEDRERWRRLRRRVEPGVPARVAERALIELVGPLEGPLEDASAGAWRAHRFADPADWPSVVAYQERCKLLARAGGARWLARFAGLGRAGAHALSRAQALADAGFGPEVAGLGHGFLVERWLSDDDTAPLSASASATAATGTGAGASFPRDRLVEHVARYLCFRRDAFPADAARGASPARLLEMIRRNASLAPGGTLTESATLAALDRFCPADLAARARPIEIDAKLHPWEWLVHGGRLVKTDGVDHHAGHDLVGCQDVAWDVAGAIVELELSPAEASRLAELVGVDHDRELLAFFHAAYLAFQLGRHALAIDVANPDDAVRLRDSIARYEALLRAALAA
jgi:hypothetical protein